MNTSISKLEEFVKQNYRVVGLKFIVDKFDTNKSAVARIAKKFGIKLTHDERSKLRIKACEKPPEEFNVNHTIFENIEMPEVAYLLGVLWADGHLSHLRAGHHDIICSTTMLDEHPLENTFMKTGKWNKYRKKHDNKLHPTWREAITFQTSNKHLFRLLEKMDYTNKIGASPCKVLKHVPENIRHYWWRGYFDGDGCIYTNGGTIQIHFSGPYAQDWAFAKQLMSDLNVTKYTITRNVSNKNNTSSALRLCSKPDTFAFLNYIYKNIENDDIGFTRKYKKFKDFDFSKKTSKKSSQYYGVKKSKNGKFQAHLSKSSLTGLVEDVHLGTFTTEIEARDAVLKYFGAKNIKLPEKFGEKFYDSSPT